MGAASQSPARSRVTDVIARVVARGMDVATTASETALHCYTARGEVTVLIPAQVFVRAARGKLDCNGNPFPAVRETPPPKSLDEQLEEDAQAARSEGRAQRAPRTLSEPPLPLGEAAARSAIAFGELVADPSLSIAAVAARHGLKRGSLQGWISANRRAEWAYLQAARVMARVQGGVH